MKKEKIAVCICGKIDQGKASHACYYAIFKCLHDAEQAQSLITEIGRRRVKESRNIPDKERPKANMLMDRDIQCDDRTMK